MLSRSSGIFWITSIFPAGHHAKRSGIQRSAQGAGRTFNRREKRRYDYATVQNLYAKDFSRPAKLVRDGMTEAGNVDVDVMERFWRPPFEAPSAHPHSHQEYDEWAEGVS